MPTDVLERDQLEHLVTAAVETFGRIDILVNNAGGWPPQPALRTGEAAFEQALRFNVVSPFLLTRFVVPVMVETAGGGAVVNISSRSASMVQPNFVAYGTAKAGLSFMTKQLATELAPKVRINAIEVGGVETDALATVLTDDDIREQMETNTPMQRVGQPEDIAACVVYLDQPRQLLGHRQDLRSRRRRRTPRLHHPHPSPLTPADARSSPRAGPTDGNHGGVGTGCPPSGAHQPPRTRGAHSP